MPLFFQRTLEKHLACLQDIDPHHAEILSKWAENLKRGIYDSETQNDGEFIQRILIDVLGYIGSSDGRKWTVAKNLPVGKGNVDVALGRFSGTDMEVAAVFELKGAKTRNLDAYMAGRKKTPVEQAWEYATDAKGVQWVLVSNYREIRLYAWGYGRKDYESFDLAGITEPAQYARFILLLSAENLLGGKTLSLLKESEQAGKDITNELYRDYKTLRSRLVKHIGDAHPGEDGLNAIRHAQTILDRVLFVAFAEDKGLLPGKTLEKVAATVNPYSPQPMWENFTGLFRAINQGNIKLNIPGYNGGLFADNPALSSLNISDELCGEFKKIGDFDFDTESSVNILGHIFEQSISDLEEMKARAKGDAAVFDKKNGKRKKEGIFYTPPHITRYIVEQSVGGWLEDKWKETGLDKLPPLTDADYNAIGGKYKGARKEQEKHKERVEKHIAAWEAYKEIVSGIRILDPACGSGAFLNEVFDYLKIEGQRINEALTRLRGGRPSLFRWDTHILANNIFGVDINYESVEITKLSLWLKTANRNEKLTYLEDNIKVGNSLIDDRAVAGDLAFDWKHEFPEILDAGGFDVIIGNPPYGAALDKKALELLRREYRSCEYQVNTYVLFYERGVDLLKQGGILGFITPATFLYQHYFKKIRSLLSEYRIKSLAKYTYPVCADAAIGDTVSFVVQKAPADNGTVAAMVCDNREDAPQTHQNIPMDSFMASDGTYRIASNKIPAKIFRHNSLNDVASIIVGIKAYQTGKGSPKQTRKIVESKPFTFSSARNSRCRLCVVGSDFHRYRFLEPPSMYLEYGEWLAEPRLEAPFFDEEKIILRQTADTIIAHLDTAKSVNLNNVYNIGKKSGKYSLKYLLGILNSRLMERIYRNIAQEKGKQHAEVKKVYLRKLPIKAASRAEQQPLVRLVEAIMTENNKVAAITLNFIDLIKNEFPLSGRMTRNWSKMEFKDFSDTLEKLMKPRKLTLPQKAEWMKHFDGEKAKVKALEAEIRGLNTEIDAMVYALYELTPDEIAAVETES